VRNTDVVTAIDDEDCLRLLRVFNEAEGHRYLAEEGLDKELIKSLPWLGISSIANLLSAIKTAKYYEMTADDLIVTVATDSAEMYQSRLKEMTAQFGDYTLIRAGKDTERFLFASGTDYLKELSYPDKKSIHNLKYYTWVEQQGKSVSDLNRLWYDQHLWPEIFNQHKKWDEMIKEFNEMTGLIKLIK
jgi:hypothetical protein